jgi:glycosyltransferase involved in cell wall biosynthesis
MLVNGLIQRKSWLAKRAWIALFERENIDKAAAIHVTSEIESRELRELGFRHSRIAVIPNGVDAPQNDLSYNSRGSALNSSQLRPVVLFLGRVNWKKGLDRLIPALAHIPEADLVIAGNDEENYQSTLTKLAKRLGVMDRVRFLGPVNVVEKWDLLRKAQVLVLPSYSENFGNVVLEAMSVGCPVVVTPEVGLAQVVKEANAGLVIEGVPEKLAVGINGLLHEPDNRRRMGEAGRRIAQEEFAWDAIAKRIERLYEACIYEARNNVESDYAGPSYL